MSVELSDILWLFSWPLFIFISYKFIAMNISHMEKTEKQNALNDQ